MEKELKTQVKQLVDDMFNEKEEASIRERTEAELSKAADSISNLTTALETKNSEFSEMEQKVVDSESKVKELEAELEAASEKLTVANSKIEEVETELKGIKKDRAAEKRIVELEDAGVVRSDKDTQMAKVREMSDEDFASYKDELVSIRASVVEELEKAKQQSIDANAQAAAEDKKTKTEETASSEDESEENKETSSEEGSDVNVEVPPANITPGQAAMASLNMEYAPGEDMAKKYAKLGEALAKKFKTNK